MQTSRLDEVIEIFDDSSDDDADFTSSVQTSCLDKVIEILDECSDEEANFSSSTRPSPIDEVIKILDDSSSIFEKFAAEPEEVVDLEEETYSYVFNNLCIGDLPPKVVIRFPAANIDN